MLILWNDHKLLADIFQGDITNIKEHKLCSLWASYGAIHSIELYIKNYYSSIKNNSNDTKSNKFDLICKVINPPKSCNDEIDHHRKLHSYQVEAYFYKSLCHKLLEVGILIPKVYYVNVDEDNKVVLLMNNLSLDFPISKEDSSLDNDEVYAALYWLSRFHAYNWENYPLWTMLGNNKDATDTKQEILWPEGCYWYLNTRKKEYNNMSKEWIRLKHAASIIASLLNTTTTTTTTTNNIDIAAYRYKTLIHGDFKSANLLFQRNNNNHHKSDNNKNNNNNYAHTRCAAYDFQYTGGGYGVRDLVQLIVSSMKFPKNCTIEQYIEIEHQLLSSYYKMLIKDINEFIKYDEDYKTRLNNNMNSNTNNSKNTNNMQSNDINYELDYSTHYPFEILMKHYELALLDYVRFMAGWGFWGGNINYAKIRSLYILDKIDSGKCLTEEQYNIEFLNIYL